MNGALATDGRELFSGIRFGMDDWGNGRLNPMVIAIQRI